MKYILFTIISFTLNLSLLGQTFNNPYNAIRQNKTVAITSIEVLQNSIKVNMEYLGSSKYVNGWISISKNTHITTQNGDLSKIIDTDNISFSPSKTKVKTDSLHKFSLYFEKVNDMENKRFHIIEDEKSPNGFNFWDIKLENNAEPSANNVVKNDYYLSQIPEVLQFIFYHEYFVESHFNSKNVFNKLIEYTSESSVSNVKNVKTEDVLSHNKSAFAYTLNTIGFSTPISSYYYLKNENGNRINHIMFYFLDKGKAENFFKSIANWYDASIQGNSATKLDLFSKNQVYFILFGMNEREGFYSVDIDVLTNEEYREIAK